MRPMPDGSKTLLSFWQGDEKAETVEEQRRALQEIANGEGAAFDACSIDLRSMLRYVERCIQYSSR